MKNAAFSVNKKSLRSQSPLLAFNEKKSLNTYTSKNRISTQKSFITMLLKLIKESQASNLTFFMSENNNKGSHKISPKKSVNLTKNNLITLKNKLILIQAQKYKELINLKNEVNNRKEKLYDLKKFNGIQKDIYEFKNLNFQFENEIKKTENLIEHKNKSLYLAKSYDCFLEMLNERFYFSAENYEEIDKIYKEKNENLFNKLIQKRDEIFLTEQNIEKIKTKINNLKYKIYEKENNINRMNNVKKDTKEYDISALNEKIYEISPHIKKKINFKTNTF